MLLIPGIIASSKLGAVGDFESIATVTVGSGGTSSISFTSIPSTFQHLQVRCFFKASGGATEVGGLTVNNNTGNIYYTHKLVGGGASASSSFRQNGDSSAKFGVSYAQWSIAIIDFLDYKDTNKYKVFRSLHGSDANGSGEVGIFSGNANTTTAISSLEIAAGGAVTWEQYSHFALYGIKG